MFTFLLSCSEDEILSDGEIVARKIQSVIDSENVTEVNIVRSNSNGGSSLIEASNEFEIDGIFIKIEANSSYNLSRLFEYEVRRSNFTDNVLLILYLAS
ncbi:hypothetical protein [Marivirga harenae]|nr:hypothetical protein [Marivirga harenae]WKV13749.1 hypothetical protein Q3Y49_07900 [Marivirga harenae]|tara:strand:+ start:41245 stop:41541 length:297 start_codon:yes stop_codon:yes gene_type:complete